MSEKIQEIQKRLKKLGYFASEDLAKIVLLFEASGLSFVLLLQAAKQVQIAAAANNEINILFMKMSPLMYFFQKYYNLFFKLYSKMYCFTANLVLCIFYKIIVTYIAIFGKIM